MANGIMWLEANANNGLTDPCTSRHLAALLQGITKKPILFRHAHAPNEMAYHLRRAKAKSWPVVYITAHGEPGRMLLDRWTRLDELARILGPSLQGRALHCSSCLLMKNRKAAEAFRVATGLRLLSGFAEVVPWIDCSAFELMLMELLTFMRKPFLLRRSIQRTMPSLAKQLAWVMLG